MDDYAEWYKGARRLTDPRVVATRVSLPSDKSFATYDTALAHLTHDPCRAS